MMASGLEAFAKPSERRLLASIFGGGDSESESESERENENENENENESGQPTKVAGIEGEADTEEPLSTIRSFRSAVDPDLEVRVVERRIKGIAHQLWPAAQYLGEHLTQGFSSFFPPEANHCVIELGAGLGLTGLLVASLFEKRGYSSQSKVVLTDLAEALDGLTENIELNSLQTRATSQELGWGCAEHISNAQGWATDCQVTVIAADVVYFEHLFAPLADTLVALCAAFPTTKVVIAHIKRWKKDQKFFVLCKKRGLDVAVADEQVFFQAHEHTGQPEKQIKRIYVITKAAGPTRVGEGESRRAKV